MAARLEFRALPLDVIEQLAVEDDVHFPVLVADRLLAIGEADDAEPARGHAQSGAPEEALFIGTAMRERATHSLNDVLRHLAACARQINHARDATHMD